MDPLDNIYKACCVAFGCDIKAPSRKTNFVLGRSSYCKIAKMHTKLSLIEIGKYVGISHSSVIQASKRTELYERQFSWFVKAHQTALKESRFEEPQSKTEQELSSEITRLREENSKLLKLIDSNASGKAVSINREATDIEKKALEIIGELNPEEIKDLIEYRIIPYKKMCEAKR